MHSLETLSMICDYDCDYDYEHCFSIAHFSNFRCMNMSCSALLRTGADSARLPRRAPIPRCCELAPIRAPIRADFARSCHGSSACGSWRSCGCHEDVCEQLFAHGASVHSFNSQDQNPLQKCWTAIFSYFPWCIPRGLPALHRTEER